MKLNKEVQAQIESLTSNEDFRQDLWVAYLSGQPHLPTALDAIQIQYNHTEEFQYKLCQYAFSEIPENIIQLFDNFSSIEQSILYMLLLGYRIHEISNRYGTSVVRIQQSINIIRKHSVWDKLLILV